MPRYTVTVEDDQGVRKRVTVEAPSPQEAQDAAMQAVGPAPRPGKIGRGTAAAIGAADGLTANFTDEIAGAGAGVLGRGGVRRGFAALTSGGLPNLLTQSFAAMGKRAIRGEGLFDRAAADEATESVRQLQGRAAQDRPLTYYGAGIGAGVASGIALTAATGGVGGGAAAGNVAGRLAAISPRFAALAERAAPAAAALGKLAPTKGAYKVAADVLSPVVRGTASGAMYGGIAGAGASDDGDRVAGAMGGAGMGAAFGGLLGGVGGLVGKPIVNAIGGVAERFAGKAARPAADEVADVLAEAQARYAAAQGKAASEATTMMPSAANALAERFGVKLTKGQQMRGLDDTAAQTAQEWERSAAAGSRGDGARQVIDPFLREQAGKLLESGRRIVGEGRDVGLPTYEVQQRASEGLRGALERADQTMSQRVSDAYDVFYTTGARGSGESAASLPEFVASKLAEKRIDPTMRTFGDTYKVAGEMLGLIQKQAEDFASRPEGFRPAQLEQFRKGLIAKIERIRPEEREQMRVALSVRDAYDEWMAKVLQTEGAIQGASPDEIAAMVAARNLYSQYADLLRSPSAPVLRDAINDGSREISGSALLDSVLGGSNTRLSAANPKAGPTLDRLVKTLGNGDEAAGRATPEFQALREAAVDRLMSPLEAAVRGGETAVPAKSVARDIRDALFGRGRETGQRLFSLEERTALAEFANLLDQIAPLPRSINQSGSGDTVIRGLAGMMQSVPGINPILGRILGGLGQGARDVWNAGGARQAITARVRDPGTGWAERLYRNNRYADGVEAGLTRGAGWAAVSDPQRYVSGEVQ